MKEYNYKIKGAPYNVKINGIEENIAKVEVNGIEFDVELEKPVAQQWEQDDNQVQVPYLFYKMYYNIGGKEAG